MPRHRGLAARHAVAYAQHPNGLRKPLVQIRARTFTVHFEMELKEDSAADSSRASQPSVFCSAPASASSSASSSKIIWVHPPTLGPRFDSGVWETRLFVVSKLPIDGHRNIKCLACEELRKSLGGDDWHSGQPLSLTVHFLTVCSSFSSCFLSGMVLICHQGRRS